MIVHYDFHEAAEQLGLSYFGVSRRCKSAGLKLKIGRHGKKYLTQGQLDKLKLVRLVETPESTGYKVDIIRIVETYHIYESKMNQL